MGPIQLRGHTTANGDLSIHVSTELPESDVEIVVYVHPMAETPDNRPSPEDMGWPPGFFERTYGCLADSPIERPPQGEYEIRPALE